ncbi:MAG: peptidase E [Chloroflexi bacterium]|nr:MAG: peptidase E [Chloroflexota bacterium]MBL1197397.1 peptidase E [Chloroflexota bacterium]NOH14693.1 peptidase E [Chloroflexota bacterium]
MQQIIAMGGGGFSMEPENPLLDQYVIDQANTERPRICFLPQASGEAENYILRFYVAMREFEVKPAHLSLFSPHTKDIEDFLVSQDIIYVGGGNTRNMMVLWKEWGLDVILHQAYEKGTILTGLSAGAICWFEQGLTDSIPGELNPWPFLGFLEDSCCPHYDGEAERRPIYHDLIKAGSIKPGHAFDDGAAGHFVDGKLEVVVTSRPEVNGYSVSLVDGEVQETILPKTYLGKESGNSSV